MGPWFLGFGFWSGQPTRPVNMRVRLHIALFNDVDKIVKDHG